MSRLEAQKRYHDQKKNDPEYIARRREHCRKWREAHKKEALEARKQYYRDNPEYPWLDSIKTRAKKLGVPFNLTVGYLRSIMTDTCPVLGIPLMSSIGGTGPTDNSPTIDRIIPELGYVEGNVMVVSKLANQIKSSATPSQIQMVAEFYSRLFSTRSEFVTD
jgi:hypothetical protein